MMRAIVLAGSGFVMKLATKVLAHITTGLSIVNVVVKLPALLSYAGYCQVAARAVMLGCDARRPLQVPSGYG